MKGSSEVLFLFSLHFCASLKEIGLEDVDWIHLAQDRIQWQAVVNTVINSWFP
jgi:hypothetical protein